MIVTVAILSRQPSADPTRESAKQSKPLAKMRVASRNACVFVALVAVLAISAEATSLSAPLRLRRSFAPSAGRLTSGFDRIAPLVREQLRTQIESTPIDAENTEFCLRIRYGAAAA